LFVYLDSMVTLGREPVIVRTGTRVTRRGAQSCAKVSTRLPTL
jgi:hypothetical protein